MKSAVSLFSRIMDDAFAGLQYYLTLWYLDDLIQSTKMPISGKREDLIREHVKDLRRLFGRAREKGFSFSIEKCEHHNCLASSAASKSSSRMSSFKSLDFKRARLRERWRR